MRKLVLGAIAVGLVGCGGGGGSSSSDVPFSGLYTGTTDIYNAGNGTTTPNTDDAATAGVVNQNGTFNFDVRRVTTVSAPADTVTGRVNSNGSISSATLRYVDGDGVSGSTVTLNGTGTTTVGTSSITIALTFPVSGQANPLRYVMTLAKPLP